MFGVVVADVLYDSTYIETKITKMRKKKPNSISVLL